MRPENNTKRETGTAAKKIRNETTAGSHFSGSDE